MNVGASASSQILIWPHGRNYPPVCSSQMTKVQYYNLDELDGGANTHPDCSGPGLNGVGGGSTTPKTCAGVPTHTVARVETFDVQSDSTNLYIKRTDQAIGWSFDLGFQCFLGSSPVRTAHMLTSAADKLVAEGTISSVMAA